LASLERAREEEGLDLDLVVMEGDGTEIEIVKAMEALHELGVDRVLVEGGSRIIWEFVQNGLFDRFTIYFGAMFIGGSGPTIMGGEGAMDPIGIRIVRKEHTTDGGTLVELERSQ
jgi:riboflavin biosynthesis pyrimidine reductase